MEPNQEKPYQIRTYKKVWKFERILYRFDRFRLPRPVTVWQLVYFFIGIILVVVIQNNTGLLSFVPDLVRYIGIPVGFSWFLSKVKLDGRHPFRWLVAMVLYLFEPKAINRYQPSENLTKCKYSNTCKFRYWYVVKK